MRDIGRELAPQRLALLTLGDINKNDDRADDLPAGDDGIGYDLPGTFIGGKQKLVMTAAECGAHHAQNLLVGAQGLQPFRLVKQKFHDTAPLHMKISSNLF